MMRRSMRWLLVLAFAGCARQGYVAVTVNLGALAGRVVRFELQAFDARGDAGPLLIPTDGPITGGIPNNSIVAVTTPLGNSLTVLLDGLGADGGILGIGSVTIPSASANTRVAMTLSPPCSSVRDCDPDGICLGTIDCTLGTCQPVTSSLAAAGAACGPSDGGQCDGNGACVLPYCGTGLFPLPPGEQCDEGIAVNGNLPDHCRANCQLPSCGDAVLDPDAGELCDLGGRNGTGAGCNATCDLTGTVTVLAGNGLAVSVDGVGQAAGFAQPGALAVVEGGLFVADELTHLIRRIDLATLEVTTIAGGFDGGSCHDTNGQGSAASFCLVTSLLAYGDGLIVGDVSALRFVTLDGGVTTFAGTLPSGSSTSFVKTGSFASSSYGGPLGLAFIAPDIYSSTTLAGEILGSDLLTQQTWVAATPFAQVQGGGLTSVGELLYAGDVATGVIAAVNPDAGTTATVVQGLQGPHGLCSDGRAVFIAESSAGLVDELTVDGGTGTKSLLSGGPGSISGLGPDAGFQQPEACVYDRVTHALYVSDLKSNLIFAIH